MVRKTMGNCLCATTGDVDNLGRLNDLRNRDVDHRVHQQLGNLDGPQNGLDDRDVLALVGELQLRSIRSRTRATNKK